ncbi:L-seryl-tRNA(Sec) selenium transferase [Ramlibacter rhizophilus]|uniref:L-seryl-tRNA(Sec) selenium transferase n=1 Tax=Ramlibacter rhizophilus TaxID=1781167 RepID=A0A4Z0BI57_9BURK|nr:L-seryl-tRNA(Sec) selenium transferase [Ramlibacter rhizophilus]TFY98460.1 L-seryl-tRNA(Sec) selenium transferase [Ramlibacter rhizophilus]
MQQDLPAPTHCATSLDGPQPAERPPIPSIDRLLQSDPLRALVDRHGRVRVRDALRERLDVLRARWASHPASAFDADTLALGLGHALDAAAAPSLRPVANLTGTVLHTNLGRALLPEEAIEAMGRAARTPCNLEFDLQDGERGERDAHVEALVCGLTGAEAALVVNNNAAAVLLVLNTMAARRPVIVSRGELVEIGGQFRVPDIMARAGARLHEVGTTNRTHLSDYEEAIDARTALLMKVHPSNYEIRGFTAAVAVERVAQLARERGLVSYSDLGSGTLADLRAWGLPHEPTVRETLAAGVDLVSFSGDKLLGGPQCGIVAGRATLVARLRRNPLKRALRVDKLTLAALGEVLRLYGDPDRLAARLPTVRLLARPREEMAGVAAVLADALQARLRGSAEVQVVDCASMIGSGALPVAGLRSVGVRIVARGSRRERDRAAVRLLVALRSLPLPIIGRLEDGAVLLDCRCLEDAEPVLLSLAALGGEA